MINNMINQVVEEMKQKGICVVGDCVFSKLNGAIMLSVKLKKPELIFELLPNMPESLKPLLVYPSKEELATLAGQSKLTIVSNDANLIEVISSKENMVEAVILLANFAEQVSKAYTNTHVIRIFGSYVLIINNRAVYSTPSPIKYCPLMYKLLEGIGGETAKQLLVDFKNGDMQSYQGRLLLLIDEIVIKGGGFANDRPLNVCERHVTFGASEIMSDALEEGQIGCCAMVSNAIGSVLTFNSGTTQGVVKTMSGLFYTTPDSLLID